MCNYSFVSNETNHITVILWKYLLLKLFDVKKSNKIHVMLEPILFNNNHWLKKLSTFFSLRFLFLSSLLLFVSYFKVLFLLILYSMFFIITIFGSSLSFSLVDRSVKIEFRLEHCILMPITLFNSSENQ